MRNDVPAAGFKLTNGRKPRTGTAKLRVQFACGYVDDRNTYTADQLRWTDTGCGWDVVAVRLAGKAKSDATWNPKSGGY